MKKKKKKVSKRKQLFKEKVQNTNLYTIEEAIALLKETSTTKFDGSVEVHIRTGIDPKKGDQLIRGTVILPHGTGKKPKIMVIASEDKLAEAQKSGADIVGSGELIDEIKKSGKINADVIITNPSMMRDLAKVAKILGPKGMMPSPKNDTVTDDIAKAVAELQQGKLAYKNDDTANVHALIGKMSFTNEHLIENFNMFIETIKKNKPTAAKGIFIKNVVLSSTMGPGIRVNA